MENENFEVEDKKQVDIQAYIDSPKSAILGSCNGILFYNFVYPLIIITILQLIWGANYKAVVESNYYFLEMIVSLAVSIITLVVAIFIAKPHKIIKAVKPTNIDQVKLMLSTFIIIVAVTVGYNSLMVLLGVDLNNGNENQASVVEFVKEVPMLAFITFVVVGPLLEEITYRYFVFGGVRLINDKLAIIVSGFVFMLLHGLVGFFTPGTDILRELILLPPYMFSGCMLAYAYNKSDNLVVPAGAHILNNLLSFVLATL